MVATNNKKSALMLLRCWHAYQAHHTAAVQKKFAEQKSKIDKIKKMISRLSSIAEKSLLTDQEKDAAMADMRFRYKKVLGIVDQLILYSQRSERQRTKLS